LWRYLISIQIAQEHLVNTSEESLDQQIKSAGVLKGREDDAEKRTSGAKARVWLGVYGPTKIVP
jgi:hypothetical protein